MYIVTLTAHQPPLCCACNAIIPSPSKYKDLGSAVSFFQIFQRSKQLGIFQFLPRISYFHNKYWVSRIHVFSLELSIHLSTIIFNRVAHTI